MKKIRLSQEGLIFSTTVECDFPHGQQRTDLHNVKTGRNYAVVKSEMILSEIKARRA